MYNNSQFQGGKIKEMEWLTFLFNLDSENQDY